MATDFASEFAKVFGNSCPPQTDWTQPIKQGYSWNYNPNPTN